MMSRSRAWACLFALARSVSDASTAFAQGVAADVRPGGESSQKLAAAKFSEGEVDFRRGEFAKAAILFEEAFALVPHANALWNAARAWQNAGELARAANHYATYIRVAQADAPDRAEVTRRLSKLAEGLGRIELHANGARSVRVDESDVHENTPFLYVSPGAHIVRAEVHGRHVSQSARVDAGATVSVAFAVDDDPKRMRPPEMPPPAAAGPGSSSMDHVVPLGAASASTHRGLPVWVAVGGGIATLAAAGATVWSGLDTSAAREHFDQDRSQANYDAGIAKQNRTNVLLAVTLVTGAATGVLSIWFVDFGGRTRVALQPGWGTLGFDGRF